MSGAWQIRGPYDHRTEKFEVPLNMSHLRDPGFGHSPPKTARTTALTQNFGEAGTAKVGSFGPARATEPEHL